MKTYNHSRLYSAVKRLLKRKDFQQAAHKLAGAMRAMTQEELAVFNSNQGFWKAVSYNDEFYKFIMNSTEWEIGL